MLPFGTGVVTEKQKEKKISSIVKTNKLSIFLKTLIESQLYK